MERLEDAREVLSFRLFFNVMLAVGNQHLFKGPDDLNGNGYFYARLCWTGVGLQANIDVWLSALLHFSVGLKRA